MGGKWREIIRKPIARPKRKTSDDDPACPRCGGDIVLGPVPCPDYIPGSMTTCAVYHQGYRCTTCGRQFEKI